jgi:16S rRNA (guanine527-N7)-methyltransferase
MDYTNFRELFIRIFEKNGLISYATEENIRKFHALTDMMIQTNRVMNITALTNEDKIIPLHYADCVKICHLLPEHAKVIDIGCGGGFPLLPLAIVRPDLQLTGLDSTEKKIRYVEETAKQLDLCITGISARAEELAKEKQYRETYDVAISRAVARLNLLDELCIPFVKIGGQFIAMKGTAGGEELAEAANGIQRLGGIIENYPEYELYTTYGLEKRTVITVRKDRSTPKEFPRSFGAIKKRPI